MITTKTIKIIIVSVGAIFALGVIGGIVGHFTSPDLDGGRATFNREPFPTRVFEDGSAEMSDGTSRPEDSFEWNCRTMGNRVCGMEEQQNNLPFQAPEDQDNLLGTKTRMVNPDQGEAVV